MSNTIYIDSTSCITELCKIGGEMNTDKSPLSMHSVCCGHKKGYTAVYQLLFAQYKNKFLNIAEIGIEEGASLKTWSKFFTTCKIYAFEIFDHKIENCKNMNIPNVIFTKTDVDDIDSLHKSFSDTSVLFDIIIDDSSHIIKHQNNIIQTVSKYLKPGGMLIIEDITRNTNMSEYSIDSDIWCFYTFVVCHHDNRNCPDNDKILYLIKA
jgi:hypothetical protein